MDPGNPEKSWNFILAFSRTGKSWKIVMQALESPGNLLTLIKEFSLKQLSAVLFLDFLFCKGLLLQLLCIWKSWKNVFES